MEICINTIIPFGKHKGKKGIEIARNLNYIYWIKEKTNHTISRELMKEVNKMVSRSNGRIFNDHCDSTYDPSYYGLL